MSSFTKLSMELQTIASSRENHKLLASYLVGAERINDAEYF